MSRRLLFRALSRWVGPRDKANRPRRTALPYLEELERREMPSANPLLVNDSSPAAPLQAPAATSTPKLLGTTVGLNFGNSQGWVPPNASSAAGTNNLVETVNQAIAIYPLSGSAAPVTDSLTDFFRVQGHLSAADASSSLRETSGVVWDDQIQRFVIGDMDLDPATNVSRFDLAVSKTSDPTTLTAADWNFFQVNTTEAGYHPDFPGPMGYNADALVFTLNMYDTTGSGANHAQVVAISSRALAAGTPLTQGANYFRSDDFNAFSLRATTMHDAKPGDPLWLVQEDPARKGSVIDVVKMTNVLANNATFTDNYLAVNPYATAVALRQPDGTSKASNIDSRILNAAERGGTLVASQTISNSAGNEDSARWYQIDVRSGTPQLVQQGTVGGPAGTYIAYPAIDINAGGQIGMTYVRSGTGAGQFLSMFVTGREPNDPAGTMQTPVLVKAGVTNYADYTSGGQLGDFNSLSVAADGSFWATTEFADGESLGAGKANWGTAIGHFSLAPVSPPPPGTPPPPPPSPPIGPPPPSTTMVETTSVVSSSNQQQIFWELLVELFLLEILAGGGG